MKAIQAEALISGNYDQFIQDWRGTNPISYGASVPNYDSLNKAGNDIITKIGAAGLFLDPDYRIYVGKGNDPATMSPGLLKGPKFTIMAALPGSMKFYCIGSNGASSKDADIATGDGCGGNWKCPGCYADGNPDW
jgi:hypothetical protein